jgi:hypothetical protein
MTKDDLYSLDTVVYNQISEERKAKENELKAYFSGMEKGADMMLKAVKNFIENEQQNGGAPQ